MAGVRRIKKIPFAVDRNNKANLSTQLSDGFRHAILTGYYRPGDRLPSFSDIAMELGVSIRAPREAIKRLISENLVRSRPRVGCEVIASGERVWKGSVVCTFVAELEGSYYFPMMIGALRRKMIASGYSVITVAVDAGSDGKPDFSQLDALCRVKNDLILAIHPPEALTAHIAASGIPALVFGGIRKECEIEKIDRSSRHAAQDIMRTIVRSGVRSVLLVNYAGGAEERKLLEEGGVEVESISVAAEGPNFLEVLRRRSMEAVRERFAPGNPRPDLIFFTDDHVAQGGLLGLALCGVSSPGDVGIVTMSNRGSAPVWPSSLACIEFDPVDDGENLADRVVAKIEGRAAPEREWKLRFVKGETFPCRKVDRI